MKTLWRLGNDYFEIKLSKFIKLFHFYYESVDIQNKFAGIMTLFR